MQRVLVRQVERQVIELNLATIRHSGRQLETLQPHVGVLEERHRLLRTELEEVVPKRLIPEVRDKSRTEHTMPEPHGGIHVRGHQRQMIDPPPEGPRSGVHGGKGTTRPTGQEGVYLPFSPPALTS